MYTTDGGGFSLACSDIKIFSQGSTWATRLSQLAKQKGRVRIITYSLPKMDYVCEQLGRRPTDIHIIAHDKFAGRAAQIMAQFPGIEVRTSLEVHSKILLIEPHTLYISSANFGSSGWHEATIGLHSEVAHDWYLQHEFIPLWEALKP